jgi:SPX domain protein involved in polyphosphate accumulation
MALDKMQLQRLELKYKINEDTALRIRDFVQSYLEPDEYAVGKPDFSYPVHSLYLDSDDMLTYWETINGNKNRFKLRLRYYSTKPDAPVFFEIKRRMNSCIMKMRGGVRRRAVDWLLAGHIPEPEHMTSTDPKHVVALQQFCQRMATLKARPKAHIYYMREAWVTSGDNSVRLTLDRRVQSERDFTSRLPVVMENPVLVFGDEVILELKFTQRYPIWFQDLIRAFNIRITGAAKYVEGVAAVGEDRFFDNTPNQILPGAFPELNESDESWNVQRPAGELRFKQTTEGA